MKNIKPLWQECIEEFGGYDAAKKAVDEADKSLLKILNIEAMRSHLLEYRRENNIFDMGDYIIYEDELMVFAMWSDAINDCAYVGYAYADDGFLAKKEEFRHATDQEIKAGHRINNHELEELELVDVGPNCKNIGKA